MRASRSGDGCGANWPLCNGQAIPAAAAGTTPPKTLIEYAHRLTSALDGLLVAGLALWAFVRFPKGHRVRQGAALSTIFIVTESLIGAGLVLLRLVGDNASVARAVYLSIHLTNTFILIAVLALTAWWSGLEKASRMRLRDFLAGRTGAAIAAALAIGVSGAVAALGATLFPERVPAVNVSPLTPAAQLLFSLKHYNLHPLAALLAGGYLLHFARVSTTSTGNRHDRWVRRWALLLALLVPAQWVAGLVNAAFFAPVGLQMIHLLLADLLWAALVLLAAANNETKAL